MWISFLKKLNWCFLPWLAHEMLSHQIVQTIIPYLRTEQGSKGYANPACRFAPQMSPLFGGLGLTWAVSCTCAFSHTPGCRQSREPQEGRQDGGRGKLHLLTNFRLGCWKLYAASSSAQAALCAGFSMTWCPHEAETTDSDTLLWRKHYLTTQEHTTHAQHPLTVAHDVKLRF